jgi:hypothetical protein
MNNLYFTVRMNTSPTRDEMVFIDTFFTLKCDDETWNLVGQIEALRELSVVPPEVDKISVELSQYMKHTEMRIRCNNDSDMHQHILCLILPEDFSFTHEGLEIYLNNMTREELIDFFDRARV